MIFACKELALASRRSCTTTYSRLERLKRSSWHIPGILTLYQGASISETIDELIVVTEFAFDDEFQDRIDYLPVS